MSRTRDILGTGLVLMALVMQVVVVAHGSRICVRPQVESVAHCHGPCHGDADAEPSASATPESDLLGPGAGGVPMQHCCLGAPGPFVVRGNDERMGDLDEHDERPASVTASGTELRTALRLEHTGAVTPSGLAPPLGPPDLVLVRTTVLRT